MKNFLAIIIMICLSTSILYAQGIKVRGFSSGKDPSKLMAELKDSVKPDIYIDGVKYDQKILSLLDQEKISSIKVLEGEAAVKEYNAPNGVVLITSVAAAKKSETPTEIKIRGTRAINNKRPVVVIDGKVANQEELSKLSNSDVESIVVLRDEKTLKKYNASDGVIVVKTYKLKDDK